jgi:hypothetical protein
MIKWMILKLTFALMCPAVKCINNKLKVTIMNNTLKQAVSNCGIKYTVNIVSQHLIFAIDVVNSVNYYQTELCSIMS